MTSDGIPMVKAEPIVRSLNTRQQAAAVPTLDANVRAEFTAIVLQTFLDTAVRDDLVGGAGGQIWRSFLVEHLAKSLAQTGQIDVFQAHEPQTPNVSRVESRTPRMSGPVKSDFK